MPSVFLSSDTSVTANATALVVPKAQAHVYFRPHSAYKGEFGFDWMRTGDTGHNGDDWYKNIVGDYRKAGTTTLEQVYTGGVFTQSNSKYSKLSRKYERIKHPTRPSDLYLVPIVNLLPGKKAKFSLKVEVKNAVSKIEFFCDPKHLKTSITEIADTSIGKQSLSNHLEVEFLKESSVPQVLEVQADGEFAGKLLFLANDKAHRFEANVVFVQVWTDIIGSGTPNKGITSGREDELKKYLNQALVQPKITSVDLDLSSDATFNSTYSASGKIINASSDGIQDRMLSKLSSVHGAGKYDKHYKIFFVNEDAGGLYGRGYGIPSTKRSVVVYKKGFADSTLAHELLHGMGLYHSFDNDSKVTFEKYKTDNIMDYSDIATPALDVISTWHWQWPLIHANVEKEK